MFWLSDDAEPSVPIPTVTPWRTYSRTAAMPEPSRRLEPALWDTWAPLAPSNFMSSSVIHTACAAENHGPTMPHASMICVIDMPETLNEDAERYFGSLMWVCMARPCSRATSRQPIMNSRVQCCGMVGALPRRNRSDGCGQRL